MVRLRWLAMVLRAPELSAFAKVVAVVMLLAGRVTFPRDDA